MATRVNNFTIFKYFNPLKKISSGLIHINDVVCFRLNFGGCIAAGTLDILCVGSDISFLSHFRPYYNITNASIICHIK